jgi:hypothetical protein
VKFICLDTRLSCICISFKKNRIIIFSSNFKTVFKFCGRAARKMFSGLYVKFLGRVRLNLTLQRALHRSARFHINQTVSGELSIFQFHISVGKSIALSSPNAHKALKGLQSFFLRFFRRPPPRNDVLLRKKRSGLKVKVQSSTQQSLLPLVDGRSGRGRRPGNDFFPFATGNRRNWTVNKL